MHSRTKKNKEKKWFNSFSELIKNCVKNEDPIRVTDNVIIDVCKLSAEYGFFIKWYESGIVHEIGGRKRFEPRDGWVNNYAGIVSVESYDQAVCNNKKALRVIEEDIEEVAWKKKSKIPKLMKKSYGNLVELLAKELAEYESK